MEHESFEDSAVAAYMNEHFVSIKVDREERPDVDQVYMNAAQLLTGRGGWPLNAVALPDGKPFFAGTYLPKDQWVQVLHKLVETYQNDAPRLKTIAAQVTEGVQTIDQIAPSTTPPTYTANTLDGLFETWEASLDFKEGGMKGAPKFPMPVNLEYLMRYYYHSGNEKAKQALLITLDKMALGGIYDHLGGGFARYSTDTQWKVPHFEKMLYDNAQLVSLYSHAFQLTGDSLYKDVVYETLAFIEREMSSPEGAFYSSLDADSEGEEGKFYVWEAGEVDEVLDQNAEQFKNFFQVSASGNWENGQNILHLSQRFDDFAHTSNLSPKQFRVDLQRARSALLQRRGQRARPGLDTKVLTSWNALMLNGYIDAYRAFGEERFLNTAIKNAEFLRSTMMNLDFTLQRNYKEGIVTIPAFLDDYAFLIQAYINLYQATFDESWLHTAKSLTDYVLEHFDDESSPLLYYTSDNHPSLIARQKELDDNVIPASNSVVANNLWLLGTLFYEDDYLARANAMLEAIYPNLLQYPNYYANWARLLSNVVNEPYEVAIVGDNFQVQRQEFDKHFLPNVIYLGGYDEGTLILLENKLVNGKTMIYVCQQKVCQLPVTQVQMALDQLN